MTFRQMYEWMQTAETDDTGIITVDGDGKETNPTWKDYIHVYGSKRQMNVIREVQVGTLSKITGVAMYFDEYVTPEDDYEGTMMDVQLYNIDRNGVTDYDNSIIMSIDRTIGDVEPGLILPYTIHTVEEILEKGYRNSMTPEARISRVLEGRSAAEKEVAANVLETMFRLIDSAERKE